MPTAEPLTQDEVENYQRAVSCQCHMFAVESEIVPGYRFRCLRCGCTVDAVRHAWYLRGRLDQRTESNMNKVLPINISHSFAEIDRE